MFKVDPNKKCFVPIGDITYREIDTIDYHQYNTEVPDHLVLKLELGDTRGPSTYVLYSAKSNRYCKENLCKLIDVLCQKAKKDILNG